MFNNIKIFSLYLLVCLQFFSVKAGSTTKDESKNESTIKNSSKLDPDALRYLIYNRNPVRVYYPNRVFYPQVNYPITYYPKPIYQVNYPPYNNLGQYPNPGILQNVNNQGAQNPNWRPGAVNQGASQGQGYGNEPQTPNPPQQGGYPNDQNNYDRQGQYPRPNNPYPNNLYPNNPHPNNPYPNNPHPNNPYPNNPNNPYPNNPHPNNPYPNNPHPNNPYPNNPYPNNPYPNNPHPNNPYPNNPYPNNGHQYDQNQGIGPGQYPGNNDNDNNDNEDDYPQRNASDQNGRPNNDLPKTYIRYMAPVKNKSDLSQPKSPLKDKAHSVTTTTAPTTTIKNIPLPTTTTNSPDSGKIVFQN